MLNSQIRVTSISEVRKEKQRKDGKVQREFISVKFADASNPFAIKTYNRNFFQMHNADGKAATWGALNVSSLKTSTD